jgi:glycosyltransferase involved in cell wall biosynthesis
VNPFDLLLAALGVPVFGAVLYLLLLTALSGKITSPEPRSLTRRFRVVVPAHDEAEGIASTIESLLSVAYPCELFDVLVVADNCSDDTAARARAAGALVIERQDAVQRGKGYALLHAFERLPEGLDAVAVIDADTVVSRNLLSAFSARLDAGASAVQADYAVRNPDASWRTRLLAIALGSFHVVRSRGRERLGLSCGLRGNGMCFATSVLRAVPHEAFSIVEDVEYGIRLGEAGHRVHYADEAHVYGEMVSSARAARSQRDRWEGGRVALRRRHAGRLLRAGMRRHDRVLLDLGLDLVVPPLSRLAVLAVLGVLSSALAARVAGGFALSLSVWGGAVMGIVAYVLRGWSVSGTGVRGLLDLLSAPAYVAWKLTARPRGAGPEAEWIRTERETEQRGRESARPE